MRDTSQRQEKVATLLKRIAAQYLVGESNGTSLITITRSDISKDLKNATLYISVLPEDREEEALLFAKRKRTEVRDYIRSKTKMKILPMIDFEIDAGEKNRQNIERIVTDKRNS